MTTRTTPLECLEFTRNPAAGPLNYVWGLYYAERGDDWLWMVRENDIRNGVHRAWGTLVDPNFAGKQPFPLTREGVS